MARLRRNERCPIHGRYDCCGRERKPSERRRFSGPVRTTPDGREICTPAEMRRRLSVLLHKQGGACALCLQPIDDYREATIDHIRPRGMGAAFRDDSWKNIQAVHALCNQAKGSRRI